MPSEKEAFAAVIERLNRKRVTALAVARDCEERIKFLRETIDTLDGEVPIQVSAPPEDRMPSGWIKENTERFLTETGKGETGFSPAELVTYLRALGHQGKNLYSTVYESLKRDADLGKYRREGGKFYLAPKHLEPEIKIG